MVDNLHYNEIDRTAENEINDSKTKKFNRSSQQVERVKQQFDPATNELPWTWVMTSLVLYTIIISILSLVIYRNLITRFANQHRHRNADIELGYVGAHY